MKKSLGRKICWIGSLLIAAFVLLNVIFTYFFMAPFSTLFYREQMEDLGSVIEQMNLEKEQDFKDKIDEIDDNHNVKVTIIDGEKNVIYTSRARLNTEGIYWKLSMDLFDSDRQKVEKGENVFLTRKRQQKNNKKSIQVIMIRKIDEDRYVVMSRSYQSLQNAMYSAIIFDLAVGVFIILLGWITVYRLSRSLVVPLRKMTTVAENISNLNFDAKVELKSQDELGQLGKSINKMSGHLEENLMQLQEDIESRKRLVRNLSHEIKSPMAVIMGYSERMPKIMKQNPEKALEYCEIISNESARVDMIIKEMLELSKMEQGMEDVKKQKVGVERLLENVKERFYEENMEKNIQYIEMYNKGESVYADVLLLERAIYNLISNAVSHGVLEQMSIRVTGERKQEYYEFRIFNTGSYIEETEILSIWEPFSKVDKVRTRGKQNGYGVGLSIVREIVEIHEGYYSVQNIDDGVEFLMAIKG